LDGVSTLGLAAIERSNLDRTPPRSESRRRAPRPADPRRRHAVSEARSSPLPITPSPSGAGAWPRRVPPRAVRSTLAAIRRGRSSWSP